MRAVDRRVLTFGLAIVLAGCGANVAPPASAAGTAAASAVQPSPAAASPEASPRPPSPGALDPGAPYHLDLPVLITFTVPAGWTFQGSSQDASFIANPQQTAVFAFLVVDNLYRDPCHWQKGLLDPPVGPGVDDLVKAIATLPGFRVAGPTSVTIGGLPAQRLDVVQTIRSSACDGSQMKVWSWEPTGRGSDFYGGGITIWVLSDGAKRLVAFSWAAPAVIAAPSDIAGIARSI